MRRPSREWYPIAHCKSIARIALRFLDTRFPTPIESPADARRGGFFHAPGDGIEANA